jgi:4,5-DOPA dioxygenase extradiol
VDRHPVLFFGHGSPMYVLQPNRYTQAWSDLGERLRRPSSILVISAHWLTRGIWLTSSGSPQTIHDFGGFPQALFDIQYPAPGSPALANRVQELVRSSSVILEENEWGIDHGAWSVLKYIYPDADIPVVQFSLDASLDASGHYRLAKEIAPLRDEDVLIIASGNVVHNLSQLKRTEDAIPYPWAKSFNQFFAQHLLAKQHQPLLHWQDQGEAAQLAVPTPEHYWPALYPLAMQDQGEGAEIIVDGIEMGSMGMLSYIIQ